MSKIGQQPITIPEGTQTEMKDYSLIVTGKEGQLQVPVPRHITVEKKDNLLIIKRDSDDQNVKALHGLIRSLINNAVLGVNKPWEKRLEIVGTGYRVKMQGTDVVLELGFSHSITFKQEAGVQLAVEGTNKISIKGIDKQLVGQVAYQIKSLKKPDPYKGKGVRYEGEHIKLKAGKKAKTAGK